MRGMITWHATWGPRYGVLPGYGIAMQNGFQDTFTATAMAALEGERGCPGRWWVPGRSWKVKEAALESPGGDGLPWTFEPRSMYMHAAPSPTRRPCPHPQRNPRAAWPEPSLSPQHLVSGGYAIRSRSDRPSLVQLRPP